MMWPFKKKQENKFSKAERISNIDDAIKYIAARGVAYGTEEVYNEARKLLIEAQRTSKQTTLLLKQMIKETK